MVRGLIIGYCPLAECACVKLKLLSLMTRWVVVMGSIHVQVGLLTEQYAV